MYVVVSNKLNIQKRQHRERSQPVQRQKLGLLEKHKDYVKRAQDFHSKQARLQTLREKAALRNKDEFYFGMIKSKTIKGVHVQTRGNEPLPTDLVKVLKTQDAGYIRTQQAMEQSRVERLQDQINSLLNLGQTEDHDPMRVDNDDMWDAFDNEPVASTSSATSAPPRKHIVFTDNLEAVKTSEPAQILKQTRSTTNKLIKTLTTTQSNLAKGSQHNKIKSKQSKKHDIAFEQEQIEREIELRQQAIEHETKLRQELEARQQRLKDLNRAMRELELQKYLMGKGSKQIVKPKQNKNSSVGSEQNDWSLGDREERMRIPEGEQGIVTGARVWKFKTPRKR
ncbi:hypothetical protein OIO90_001053 [Microbotryomycetes sp. JL221]|nr:hypothetical protein OIO90_001053 [Microbotryomycetes sp. JL221]